MNKYGTYSIVGRDAWNRRLETLQHMVQYWMENTTDKTVEVVQLYFTEC
jgi:hypothetical protein